VNAAALEFEGITKTFGSTSALADASFRIDEGTVHCLLGENGAGKSTLCNLVFGAFQPDRGTLRLFGEPYRPNRPGDAIDAGVAMVHQHFSLIQTMTVRENLLLHGRRSGLSPADLDGRLAEVADLHGLAVDPDAAISDLPVGVRQRVEIVRCLLARPRLLLLDEPTGVLAPDEVESLLRCCRSLADAGQTVILVSHKLGDIVKAGDAATVLRGGRVVADVSLSDTSVPELVGLMVGRSTDTFDPVLAASLGLAEPVADTERPAEMEPARAGATARERGDVLLDLRGIHLRRADGSAVLDGIDLRVRSSEIVGIAGVEGNGQSELTAIIGGSLAADEGDVLLHGVPLGDLAPSARTTAGLGLVPEDRLHEGCVPALSVAENLFLGRLGSFRRAGFLDRRALDRAAVSLLEPFDVRYSGPRAPMHSLSGGNQQKVVLARELSLDPLKVLVAAQPTRGLDVGAVDAVLGRLRAAADDGVAVVLVSSELDELLAVCDRIVVAFRGRLVGEVVRGEGDAREQLGRLMTGSAA
jgi:ABC-type uncharacterized transport system ATPase subunit